MRFCDGGIKGGFEEGFDIGFDVWVDCINNPWRKTETCTRANGFQIEFRGGSDNLIFKFSL